MEPRRIQDALRHDNRDECHDREVGVERLEMLERGVPAERSGLAQRKAEFERLGLQRVRASRRRVGRCEDMNDFLAMRNQRLECLFRERRLADQYDSQRGQPRRSQGYQTKLTVARSAAARGNAVCTSLAPPRVAADRW